MLLSTFKALKALYRWFNPDTQDLLTLAACEELELDKTIESRPHPQPWKSHSLDIGPEALEAGNVAPW